MSFNLKKTASSLSDCEVQFYDEMSYYGIFQQPDGSIVLSDNPLFNIDDDKDKLQIFPTVSDSIKFIKLRITNLIKEYMGFWDNVDKAISDISCKRQYDNKMWLLETLKSLCYLSSGIEKLTDTNTKIQGVIQFVSEDKMMLDCSYLSYINQVIDAQNYFINLEVYRIKLLMLIDGFKKKAYNNNDTTSGPWMNLDLPMPERVWTWADDESFLIGREQTRRRQRRYHPEYQTYSPHNIGHYYEWWEPRRSPYLWSQLATESVYPMRQPLMR